MNDWISVKDRLPSETKRYLVFYQDSLDALRNGTDSGMKVARFVVGRERTRFSKRKPTFGKWEAGSLPHKSITHWMPLPAPPKQQD